jgi:hypothetical protein
MQRVLNARAAGPDRMGPPARVSVGADPFTGGTDA